jgi:hypothetical protein
MYRNDVKTYEEIFSPGVWYDLHVLYSSDQTKIDANWNKGAILNVVSISWGVVATLVGGAALPLTGGASGLLLAAGIGTVIAGGVSAGVAIAGSAMAGLSTPANVVGLFGANDHNYYIDGGISGHLKKGTETVEIDTVKPLVVSYKNCQSGEKFENGGYKVPD